MSRESGTASKFPAESILLNVAHYSITIPSAMESAALEFILLLLPCGLGGNRETCRQLLALSR
jgi:hypothetical protein